MQLFVQVPFVLICTRIDMPLFVRPLGIMLFAKESFPFFQFNCFSQSRYQVSGKQISLVHPSIAILHVISKEEFGNKYKQRLILSLVFIYSAILFFKIRLLRSAWCFQLMTTYYFIISYSKWKPEIESLWCVKCCHQITHLVHILKCIYKQMNKLRFNAKIIAFNRKIIAFNRKIIAFNRKNYCV